MFHYVDFGEENRAKKKIIDNLVISSQADRGLGLTVTQAESVDALLKSCEDIETQATLVLKQLGQTILKNSPYAQDGVNRLFVIVRQGIKVLTNTTFKNIPITDIQNLSDYKKSLTDIYDTLEERFIEGNERIFNREPLKGRTKAQYKQDTGVEYRPPVKAKTLQSFLSKKNIEDTVRNIKRGQERSGTEAAIDKRTELYQRYLDSYDDFEKQLAEIEVKKQVMQSKYDAANADYNFILPLYESQQRTLDNMEAMDPTTFNYASKKKYDELKSKQAGLKRDLDLSIGKLTKFQFGIAKYEKDQRTFPLNLKSLEERMKATVEEIQNLKRDMTSIPADEPVTDVITQQDFDEQLILEEKANVGEKDYELVMKDFKLFINSLSDGLIRFTSGLSGKLSKSQVTNFRTPFERSNVALGGGMFSGHYNYGHTRFL